MLEWRRCVGGYDRAGEREIRGRGSFVVFDSCTQCLVVFHFTLYGLTKRVRDVSEGGSVVQGRQKSVRGGEKSEPQRLAQLV